MSPDLDAQWAAIVARGEERERLARAYADAALPAAFRERSGHKLLVSRDLDYPPDGWRVTTFGADGQPWGHYCCRTAFDAFEEVLRSQPEPIGRNHPATLCTEEACT
jgi:hypothetical protein